MATEERTVLGPVTTICGSALKIALYIYTAHTLNHAHERQQEPSGSITELEHLESCEHRRHTSSGALLAFPLPGRAAGEEHPLFTSIHLKTKNVKQSVTSDTPFVLLCRLVWSVCSRRSFGNDLIINDEQLRTG